MRLSMRPLGGTLCVTPRRQLVGAAGGPRDDWRTRLDLCVPLASPMVEDGLFGVLETRDMRLDVDIEEMQRGDGSSEE